MLKDFQLKLKSMVWVVADQHWFIKKSTQVAVTGTTEVITTKRGLYAAFIGPIPAGDQVVADCGNIRCCSPYHAILEKSFFPSRGLDLSWMPTEGSVEKGPKEMQKGKLPKTISRVALVTARSMSDSLLCEVRAATGLNYADIIKIRSGLYDWCFTKEYLAGIKKGRF